MIQAQHTIASPAALLKTIKVHYPSLDASGCRFLALSCDDNFRIKGTRQDYAFRLFRYGWWPENDVEAWLNGNYYDFHNSFLKVG